MNPDEIMREIKRLEAARPAVEDDPYTHRVHNDEITRLIEKRRALLKRHKPRKGIV